jgi:hypothetical protein
MKYLKTYEGWKTNLFAGLSAFLLSLGPLNIIANKVENMNKTEFVDFKSKLIDIVEDSSKFDKQLAKLHKQLISIKHDDRDSTLKLIKQINDRIDSVIVDKQIDIKKNKFKKDSIKYITIGGYKYDRVSYQETQKKNQEIQKEELKKEKLRQAEIVEIDSILLKNDWYYQTQKLPIYTKYCAKCNVQERDNPVQTLVIYDHDGNEIIDLPFNLSNPVIKGHIKDYFIIISFDNSIIPSSSKIILGTYRIKSEESNYTYGRGHPWYNLVLIKEKELNIDIRNLTKEEILSIIKNDNVFEFVDNDKFKLNDTIYDEYLNIISPTIKENKYEIY